MPCFRNYSTSFGSSWSGRLNANVVGRILTLFVQIQCNSYITLRVDFINFVENWSCLTDTVFRTVDFHCTSTVLITLEDLLYLYDASLKFHNKMQFTSCVTCYFIMLLVRNVSLSPGVLTSGRRPL